MLNLAWIMNDLDDVEKIDDSRVCVCVVMKRMRRIRRLLWAPAH